MARVSAACPCKARDPAEDGPAEQQVDQKDGARAVMPPMVRDDRRREIEHYRTEECKQTKHHVSLNVLRRVPGDCSRGKQTPPSQSDMFT